MADQKLSALGSSAPTDSALMYLVKALTSFKTTFADIYSYIKGKLDADVIDGGTFV